MRTENKRMKTFLKSNGINVTPKYQWRGSLKGTWHLQAKQHWDMAMALKLTKLSFLDFDSEPLNRFSGNGEMFSVFVKGHNEFLAGVSPGAI